MFADDLNVFQKFATEVDNAKITRTMEKCREKVHKWGRINRVSFDAGKEHIIILHPIHGEGDPFKLLGCLVDCKLVMQQAVESLLCCLFCRNVRLLGTFSQATAQVVGFPCNWRCLHRSLVPRGLNLWVLMSLSPFLWSRCMLSFALGV